LGFFEEYIVSETKKISVIIPVYNVRPYLEKCLDSVITQAYRNLEIIVVDDGSTDGSGAICDEYAHKAPRVIVIHQENGGVSSYQNLKKQPFIDKESLCINMLRRFRKLRIAFPFRYSKAFRKRFRCFLADNKALNEYHLHKHDRLYLRLPFPVFMLLYNRFTKKIHDIFEVLRRRSDNIMTAKMLEAVNYKEE
jgi:hypothetical protein